MNIRPYVISFAALNAVTTFAAVPLRWTDETSRVQPAVFDAYQGETLTFEAALQSKGKPLEAPLNYSFFWQTNGMGNSYWETPCPVPSSSLDGASTNVLFATFTPSMDVGARVYNCFIGSPSNIYHAAFQLRLRPSPGATPNALPLPTPVIDFARVRVLNPPWGSGGGGGCDTNAVDILANSAVVTNALTVATTNRVASLETATNNLSSSVSGLASSVSSLSSSVSGLASSKADRNELGGYLPLTGGTITEELYVNKSLGVGHNLYATFFSTAYNTSWDVVVPALYYSTWYYLPNGSEYPKMSDNEIAVKGDISAANPTFSKAVLDVNVDFATNTTGAAYVAVTNALAGFGFDAEALAELPGGKVYGSIGALLAALAAAVTWLKKKALVGGLTGGVPDDPKVHDFFTNSNSLLLSTIAANSARLAFDEDGEIIVTMNTED